MCLKLIENLCMIQIVNYIVYCQTWSRTLQIELQERVAKDCTTLNWRAERYKNSPIVYAIDRYNLKQS